MDIYFPSLGWVLLFVVDTTSSEARELHDTVKAGRVKYHMENLQHRLIDYRPSDRPYGRNREDLSGFKAVSLGEKYASSHITIWPPPPPLDVDLEFQRPELRYRAIFPAGAGVVETLTPTSLTSVVCDSQLPLPLPVE